MHAMVFTILCLLLALFAFASARAGEYLVAIPAAILAAWLGDNARQALRRRMRGQA